VVYPFNNSVPASGGGVIFRERNVRILLIQYLHDKAHEIFASFGGESESLHNFFTPS
jgi:hypothetical protein